MICLGRWVLSIVYQLQKKEIHVSAPNSYSWFTCCFGGYSVFCLKMGLFISRFWKKKNAEEQLEDLTQNIQKIKDFQECEEDKLRLRVRQLVIYSAIIYVFILVVYFILNPESGKEYYLVTLILFPIIIFLVRRFVIFYFKRKITRNKLKIEVYIKEKQKILDDVKETETYKVAKRILEKYDVPQSSKKFTPPRVSTPIPIPKPTLGAVTPYQTPMINTDLRRRYNQNNQLMSAQKAPPTLVRPIVTENKGVFDRILQKVVGDGPNERYALICRACGNHNGMALEEEFEFLSYRCAFCSYFNPARKQRIAMQNALLQNLNLLTVKNTSDSDSSDDRRPLEITELEDSESESKEDKTVETSAESIRDDDEKIVRVEETTPSDKDEKLNVLESIDEPQLKSDSVTDDKPLETSLTANTDENKENGNILNEVNTKAATVLDHKEIEKEEISEETVPPSESESKSVIEEVSPMEVDEDESPGTDLSTSVKKISLDS